MNIPISAGRWEQTSIRTVCRLAKICSLDMLSCGQEEKNKKKLKALLSLRCTLYCILIFRFSFLAETFLSLFSAALQCSETYHRYLHSNVAVALHRVLMTSLKQRQHLGNVNADWAWVSTERKELISPECIYTFVILLSQLFWKAASATVAKPSAAEWATIEGITEIQTFF